MKIKNLILLVLLSFNSISAFAWKFTTKLDASTTTTSNVNSSNTAAEKDSFSTLSGYVQTKKEPHRFRLKFKANRYKKYNENDSNYIEASYQIKPVKQEEYVLAVFQEKYIKTPTISTDTSSTNQGGKLIANFSKNLDDQTLGYINTNVTYKKYTKASPSRIDTKPEISFGLEHNLSKELTLTPEISIGKNISKDNYYSTLYYGPNATITYTPYDYLEIYTSIAYQKTKYSNRTYSYVKASKTLTGKEEQAMTSYEVGTLLTLFEKLVLTAKYVSYKNTSNNSSSAYSTHDVLFGIGFKY